MENISLLQVFRLQTGGLFLSQATPREKGLLIISILHIEGTYLSLLTYLTRRKSMKMNEIHRPNLNLS